MHCVLRATVRQSYYRIDELTATRRPWNQPFWGRLVWLSFLNRPADGVHNEEAQEDGYAVYLSCPSCIIHAHCSCCGTRPGSVIDPGVGPVFDTYYEKHKVRTYEGDIVVGVGVPADYELAPVPDVVVTKYPKLKKYRYVRIGKRTAIVSPSGRKVVKFID